MAVSSICSVIKSQFHDLSSLLLFDFQRLPTDIQAEAIPLILGGGDVLMAAETGNDVLDFCC